MPFALLTTAGYFYTIGLLHRKVSKSPLLIPAMLFSMLMHGLQIISSNRGMTTEISVTNILSVVAFIMVLIGSLRYFNYRDYVTYIVVSFIAAVCVWLPILAPSPATIGHAWGLKLHIVLSISAYIAISFAALYACFLLLQDYRLRGGKNAFDLSISLSDIERTMMRFSYFGELLLTLSLATGLLFIKDIYSLHVAHKLFFGSISWLIIGALLIKHFWQGFRGRSAALWLLSGFITLVLTYFGSFFIIKIFFDSY